MSTLLGIIVTAIIVVLVLKYVWRIEPRGNSGYGPLEKHAPQIVGLLLGVLLALLARVGIGLAEQDVALVTTLLTIIVPLALSWLAGKITEAFTYSKKTVDQIQRRERDTAQA